MRVTLGILLSALVVAGCEAPTPTADSVFINGAVYTVDADRSWAEAVAISDGHIVFVGSNDDAQAFVGDTTEVTELDGQMLLPGFHDSHAHVLIGVFTDKNCDLLRLPTINEVEAALEDCVNLEGFGDDEWIIGGGWGEWLFEKMSPDKALLDRLFPDRPVYLDSSYGHSAWVNSRALEIAGIHDETVAGADGVIVRDAETGEATGTLHDSAMMLVQSHLPEMTPDHDIDSVRAAINMLHEYGVTAVIEPGLDAAYFGPLLTLADTGKLDVRVLASISPIAWYSGAFDDAIFGFVERREEWRRPNLDVDSVKIYMDGVIEAGTSPLLEPYLHEEYGSGPFFYTQEKVNEYFARLDALGLQIHVHAIGDAAVRRALDGFEVMRERNGMSDNRHHMTHLQLIHPDDRPRFGELNIGATFQALWAYPDHNVKILDLPLLGKERAWQMYPIRSVHQAGGRINGASDYFVNPVDPLVSIEVAVTRQDPYLDGGDVLNEDERMDLASMIDAYTINGAYTMSLDDKQGSIEVGKRADLVVLDRNLFEITPYEISDVNVTMTIFDGRTVYRKPE
jgi:predicted amidohydrolase YtcJ